ncbi:hypothetical protein OsJ_26784 [Oryza sativa Japonica Group]|uniref:Uncharacterized protein n=1 Tax=Oryza sativa subsp. japonica TaxID=39947 RepID=A3BRN0_ORYSJ|nr:hypothetical protein OsJ_26784 [Oryza sativa Japonica Group]
MGRGTSKPPIIGRDDQQQELEAMLLSSAGCLAVIYVVGDSGVGKTILVNSVCSKPSVREHFKERIGVKVGKDAGISNILSLISKELKKENNESDNENPRSKIQRRLGEECYLIIIDGRQMSIADWNAVIHALPKNERGSRVVLITKIKPQFLDHPMNDVHEIKLTCLNQTDCRKLFHMRLHGKEEDEQNQTYLPIYYQRVYDITGGSPLAVILLAGLMHNKEYPHEWDRVLKYLESAKEKRLNRILSLSFDDLHHELKLCFLYFTAFPVSYKVYQNVLVNLWVSEGFVVPRHGKTVQQLGQLYLRQLTTRGLVTEASADGDYDIRHFFLHDSVYLFARSEAHEANFMELHDGDYFPSPDRARRLTLHNSMDRYAALDNKMPKLRSIFAIFEEIPASTAEESVSSPSCFPTCCSCEQHRSPKISRFDLTKLLKRSKFLRVIMIEGLNIGTELPEAIGGMVHLRYLSTRCRSLRRIHPSIGNLKNLQTIDVRQSLVHELPCSFWKITSLRHVFGSELIVPRWTRELKQLNTLKSVRALQDWDGSMLRRMVNLKLLDVTIQEKLKEEKARKLSDNLNNLNNLTTLILKGVDLPISSIFTAPSLQFLKTIELTGTILLTTPSPEIDKMTTSPSDFQLPNLSKLSLSKTCLQQGFIGKLGKLPLLSNLTLKDVSCDGEELVFRPDGFHCLKKLEVNDTSKRVVIEEHALPVLVSLHIIGNSRNYQHSIHPTHKIINKIRHEDINLFQRICTCHQKEITKG